MDIFLTYVTFYYERVTFDSYLTKYKSECFVCDDELDMTTIYSIQIKTYFHQHPLLKTTFSSWQIQYSFEHRKRRKVAKMSLNQFVSILVVFCLHTSYCGVPSFGSCPSLSGISDFSVPRYMGRWYEYSNTFEIFQIGGTITASCTGCPRKRIITRICCLLSYKLSK